MFHVLDEVALDAVIATEDTASDFCTYLLRKETLFKSGRQVMAASEEDLLALYLRGPTHAGEGHDFNVPADATRVIVAGDLWDWWLQSEQRAAKTAADEVSYRWDELIEKFAFHIATATQHFSSGGGIHVQEISIRWMARENRVRRRMLAETLLDAIAKNRPGQMRRRYVMPSHPGDPFWVFLVLPRLTDLEYEKYRESRRTFLQALCMIVKHVHPEALDIAGIAVEKNVEETSEDLLYLNGRDWPDEMHAAAKKLYNDTGFFSRADRNESTVWEFPISSE
jgi:hypothetical protein